MLTAGPDTEGRRDADAVRRWRLAGIVVFAIALLGGLALRVIAPSPLWLDEALTVNIAQLGFGDMVAALRNDGHPALYYVLLGWWIDLFGDGDTSVRALSGVFSLLTVPVLWRIGRRFEPPTASIAAVLALGSPFLLRYGTEARMYSLVALLAAVGWLVTTEAIEHPTLPRLLAVAATAATLVHTNYWAFWLVGAALVLLAGAITRARGEVRANLLRVAGAIVAGSATLVVWLGVLLDQAGSTGTPWAARARPAEVAVETLQAIGGSGRFEGVLLGAGLLVLALIGATAVGTTTDILAIAFRRGPASVPAAVVALTLTIGTLVALVTGSAFEARYAAVVVPFVVVLAARGAAVLPVRGAVVVVASLTLLALAVGVDNARRDRTQGQEVADAIDAGAAPGDVVAFCPDQLGPATVRSLDHPGDRFAYPTGDGTLVDWGDYLDRISATEPMEFAGRLDRAAGDHAVWLVAGFSYRGFEGRCESVFNALGSSRTALTVVPARTVFEPMTLVRFDPMP